MPPKSKVETLPAGCTDCGLAAKPELIDETDTEREFRCPKCGLTHKVHVDATPDQGGLGVAGGY